LTLFLALVPLIALVVSTPARAQTFSDGFEGLNSFWVPFEQLGSVQLSADQVHSGSLAAKFSTISGGQREVWLTHTFPQPVKGTLSVWFFDASAGSSTLYSGLYADNSLGGYGFAVNVADWNGSHYVWNGPGVNETATGIPRTTGWHKFTLRVDDEGFEALIDGTVVGAVAGDFAFDRVRLLLSGPGFRPNATFYFDDFSYLPPETFLDDFEGTGFNSFWVPVEQLGSVRLSADQVHSGSLAAKFSTISGGQREVWLTHTFPQPVKGTLSVWFFDASAGSPTLYSGLYADNSIGGYGFAVNVADWNGSHYVWNGPGVNETATGIPRTTGWHKFTLRVDDEGFEALIDGTVVGSVAGDFAFDRVRLLLSGPGFRPNATFYFDDFTFVPSSPCPPAITPSGQDFEAVGGVSFVTVTASAGCGWTAVSQASWIHVASLTPGSGNGTVLYSVDVNTSASPRTGAMTIAGQMFTVNQAASVCTVSMSHAQATLPPLGGTGSIAVSTGPGCSWTAVSQSPWITITSGGAGTGHGIVTYRVVPLRGQPTRSGQLMIGGLTFSLKQVR
jgi:hypothetical protein